jgi:hypothetical protein
MSGTVRVPWEWSLGATIIALIAIAALAIAIYVLVTHEVPCLGPIGDTPNCKGMSNCCDKLVLEPASAEFGGIVTTGDQQFSGDKTFLGALGTANNVLDNGSGAGSFAGALNYLEPIYEGGASRTITAAESNGIITVDQSLGPLVYTLPPVATSAGLKYKFVITVTGGGGTTVTIRAQSACQIGRVGASATTVAIVGTNLANQTDLIFAASQAIGAWASYSCNGTKWFVEGMSTIASGFTVA